MEETNFGWALDRLREGKLLTRRGWNGPNQYIGLLMPTDGHMTLPFLFINTVQGNTVPWLASQTDMLATDWELA